MIPSWPPSLFFPELPVQRWEHMHDSVMSQRVPVAVFTCGAETKFKRYFSAYRNCLLFIYFKYTYFIHIFINTTACYSYLLLQITVNNQTVLNTFVLLCKYLICSFLDLFLIWFLVALILQISLILNK